MKEKLEQELSTTVTDGERRSGDLFKGLNVVGASWTLDPVLEQHLSYDVSLRNFQRSRSGSVRQNAMLLQSVAEQLADVGRERVRARVQCRCGCGCGLRVVEMLEAHEIARCVEHQGRTWTRAGGRMLTTFGAWISNTDNRHEGDSETVDDDDGY